MQLYSFYAELCKLLKQRKGLNALRARPAITAFAAGLILVAPAALSVRAQDAPWGCQVLLCAAATTPSWSGIPYCVPPMTQLFQQLAHGGGWPSCPQGGETSGLGYQPYKPCPAPQFNIDYQQATYGSEGMPMQSGILQADPNGAFCGTADQLNWQPQNGGGITGDYGSPYTLQLTAAVPNPKPYYVDITPTGAAPQRFYFSLQGY